ncbi:Putative uncharacterized protein [Taphrina deformans PYCC 5710]|uniref:Uncharacterized protein n=1 Tax=Taphrina deformans (strain PYCC 5710 / ATCC 11124 / CBS 356.35 / IMI 108563 / JCM 9778 / NBRC 8474) TaxID=1097556 RepID=R4X9S1_TAPDE|nr:Putative uncharacterized protein [Taphrina deformans PYCC 5710]|eukprot:CCG80984.1 Putative uncharacterized protein [Taphrina deformans PYCC 5710]
MNEISFEKYSSVVVSLLGPPMTAEFVVPVSISAFLETLQQAITSSEKPYLFFLASVLRHNAALYLPTVSQHQIYSLTTILAGLLASEDTGIVLAALSCLASISEVETSISTKRLKNQQALFTAEKGRKVLRLVLSTISAQLSHDYRFDDETYQRDVDMVTSILRTIAKHTFQEWYQSREGSNSLKRILEKVEMQTEVESTKTACLYISLIYGKGQLPPADLQPVATRICAQAIDRFSKHNYSTNSLLTFELMLPYSQISELNISQLCNILLHHEYFELNSLKWDKCLQMSARTRVVDLLRRNADCRALLAPVLCSQACIRTIAHFVDCSDILQPSSKSFNIERRDLDRSIYKLLLSIQCDPNIPANSKQTSTLSDVLIDKFSLTCGDIVEAELNLPNPEQNISLQETSNTPHSGTSSHVWRAQLLNDLQKDAAYKHDQIVAKVDLICRDLERRAEINEEPLRESEKELEKAREMIGNLQRQLAEASCELQQRDMENQHVFEERTRFENVIASMITEIEAGNNRITDLEQVQADKQNIITAQNDRLKQTNIDLEHTRQLMYETTQHHSLQMAKVKEELEMETGKHMEFMKNYLCKSDALEVSRAELEAMVEAKTQVEATVASLQKELGTTKNSLREENEKHKEIVDGLVEQRNHHNSELDATRKLLDSLHNAMSQQNKLEGDLKTQLENTKLFADEQMALLEEAHQASLRTLNDELQLNKSRGEETVKVLQAENINLKALLSKVRSSYERRCQEFEKAQDLSKKLMAVMRGSNEDSTPQVDSPGGKHTFMNVTTTPKVVHAAKRAKERDSFPLKHIRRAMSADMTTDSDFETPGKENTVPARNPRGSRKTFRKEDSMILSELSGLGL